MKKVQFFVIALYIFIGCQREYLPRETVKVSLEKFRLDNSSIRAIEIVDDSSVIYAGSKGDIGRITHTGKIKRSRKIIADDTLVPHFRALAKTNKAVYALSIGNPALLYKYRDTTIKIVYKEVHKSVFYDAMKFFDELNGIAIGDPTDTCLSVLITRDGGNTWIKINCEFLPKIKAGEAAFAASNTNIAIFGKNAWIATGGSESRVFYSPDMGTTWNVYNTPIIQGKNTTGIYSVDFYDDKKGIICGGDYTDKFGESANKAVTTDGGKTWTVVAENKAPKYVSCVQYVPGTDGKEIFAVSTNGIFYSNNSGSSWEKVSDESFYAIRIASKKLAWLSGNGVIAKMTIN